MKLDVYELSFNEKELIYPLVKEYIREVHGIDSDAQAKSETIKWLSGNGHIVIGKVENEIVGFAAIDYIFKEVITVRALYMLPGYRENKLYRQLSDGYISDGCKLAVYKTILSIGDKLTETPKRKILHKTSEYYVWVEEV